MGSMSRSAKAPGRWCGAQRAARWNCSVTADQSSHRSSETRHIVEFPRRKSRWASDSCLPGDRLSPMSRPVFAMAAAISAMSSRSTGG